MHLFTLWLPVFFFQSFLSLNLKINALITVVSSGSAARLVVDFLEAALSDVADDQRARSAARDIVKAVAPGIAKAERPDLIPGGVSADKWISEGMR